MKADLSTTYWRLAFWGIGVVTMAVSLANATVTAMDHQLCPLVDANFARSVDRFLLGMKHTRGAFGAAFTNCPSVKMGNNMLRRF
jgi:uncharacterized membrane protein